MTTIYGIKNCSTMKKAFDQLDSLGVAYTFFDYKKQTLDADVLHDWVKRAGMEKVLNKKGTTWRKLDENDKQQADKDKDFAIDLMINNPSMIKRPIVVKDDTLIIGFDEEAFHRLA